MNENSDAGIFLKLVRRCSRYRGFLTMQNLGRFFIDLLANTERSGWQRLIVADMLKLKIGYIVARACARLTLR